MKRQANPYYYVSITQSSSPPPPPPPAEEQMNARLRFDHCQVRFPF